MTKSNSEVGLIAYSEDWQPKDLELINHVEVFQNKPAILKKVEARLNKLKEANISPTKRAEEISIKEYCILANIIGPLA